MPFSNSLTSRKNWDFLIFHFIHDIEVEYKINSTDREISLYGPCKIHIITRHPVSGATVAEFTIYHDDGIPQYAEGCVNNKHFRFENRDEI
jgi:hypothetical protein